MSNYTTIARPYAKAAFEFALDHNQLDKWEEMLSFSTQVVDDSGMQHILTSSYANNKIAEIFIAVCGEQLDDFGKNFIKILAENERLLLLPDILKEFLLALSLHRSIAEVDVVSAHELSEQQLTKITNSMEKRLNSKVKLNCSVDNSLIAGAIIRTKDFVIDGSSKGQLDRLASELQQ